MAAIGPSGVLDEVVNIFEPPETDDAYVAGSGVQINKGDLHGAWLGLVYVLAKHRIMRMSPANYRRLVRIYQKSVHDLTAEDFMVFNEIISKAPLNREGLLRLLGDILCDRGQCDYFTLRILKLLINCEITLSNHDYEFIKAYEGVQAFSRPTISLDCCASMLGLQILIDNRGLVSVEEIQTLVNEAYKPKLKAISYCNRKIFTHAPFGMVGIAAMARKLRVAYDASTPEALGHSIDRINAAFQVYVQENRVHELIDEAKLDNLENYSEDEAPFERLIWNRRLDDLVQPAEYTFVRGHEPLSSGRENDINLDNTLCKAEEGESNNIGHYRALINHGCPRPTPCARSFLSSREFYGCAAAATAWAAVGVLGGPVTLPFVAANAAAAAAEVFGGYALLQAASKVKNKLMGRKRARDDDEADEADEVVTKVPDLPDPAPKRRRVR